MKELFKAITVSCFAVSMLGCNGGSNKNNEAAAPAEQPENTVTEEVKTSDASSFDIEKIPVSDKELGSMPFFTLPEGVITTNKPIERKFDRLFFAIDSKMVPLEGRVWKSYLSPARGEEWSLPFFEKSYDEAIKAVGGVKIFDGEISREEYQRFSPDASYLGEDGSIGYTDEVIKTYVIRKENGGNIYIQLTGNNASGKLNILEEASFRQTITILKADAIQKGLSEKGKVVLHVNFDTNKATLKPDGEEAVAEIAKALEESADLKIAINGYTDNTGKDSDNLQLSKNRAKTVLDALVKRGIGKERLTSEGFGSANPIADNTSEEGKAANRRVELVKSK
jgi:outer membrane protein OmpA-like peptidoglycan-associated protein